MHLMRTLLHQNFQRVLRAPQQLCRLTTTARVKAAGLSSFLYRQKDDGPSCWKCHYTTDCCSFFCNRCNAIQPINTKCHCDYFEMFNVSRQFNLDLRHIEKMYWSLQKRLHPDLYGAKSDYEKELSAANAAVVNDAYKILKTPTMRVKYLLALHDIDALDETGSTAVDPELLMQTMEIREQIAEAPNVNVLHKIRKNVSNVIDAVIDKLGEVYDRDQDLESSKHYAVQLQYMVKCAEEIDLREEKLDGY